MTVGIKRVYDQSDQSDGMRVLVDRLWPRGVSKQQAAIDLWARDIAPSVGLRNWFGHDPRHFKEFSEKYISELENNSATNKFLKQIDEQSVITLVYAAKDIENNHAVVLKGFINTIYG